MTDRLVVYYDGDCPLCRREIAFFRKREVPGRVEWVNICDSNDAALGDNLDRCEAMSRFTVRQQDGTLLSGAAGFAAMWQVTPGFVWLGKLGALKPVQFVLERMYQGFLKVRPMLQRQVRKHLEQA